jgi:aralkylamine N-acetyltransferase
MEMKIREGYEPIWLDQILAVYNKTVMKRSNPEKVDRAFKNSYAVATCWIGDRLVGIGRMISDGEMYAGIYDVVVDPEFQKNGIGKSIMNTLVSKVPHAGIFLTSTFGNEAFYHKLGFKRHLTAMALYPPHAKDSPYLDHLWQPEIRY